MEVLAKKSKKNKKRIFAITQTFRYLCSMRTTKNSKKDKNTEEEVFRVKSDHYIICFIERCPLKEQCLRHIVGQYATTRPLVLPAVSPLNAGYEGEHCTLFRKKERKVMKRGFTNLFYDMPGHLEHAIRHQLIYAFGRRQYYEMRCGKRLIAPEQVAQMIDICRRNGWTAPLVFDGEQEDWAW